MPLNSYLRQLGPVIGVELTRRRHGRHRQAARPTVNDAMWLAELLAV
jgi:hypothetical protein